MSKISTIRDTFVTRIGTLLPNHLQIPNPYFLAENPARYLEQGWGLGISSTENTNRVVGSSLSVERNFFFIVTRQLFSDDLDITKKETLEKNLFEDQYLILEYLRANPKLEITDTIARSDYVGDGGIETIVVENLKYLQITSTVAIEYFESVL